MGARLGQAYDVFSDTAAIVITMAGWGNIWQVLLKKSHLGHGVGSGGFLGAMLHELLGLSRPSRLSETTTVESCCGGRCGAGIVSRDPAILREMSL